MRTFTNKKAVPVKQTAKQKLQYVRKNWQSYLFFLLPALLLTIIFKYIPISGVLLAFDSAAVYMIDAHPAVCQIPLAI